MMANFRYLSSRIASSGSFCVTSVFRTLSWKTPLTSLTHPITYQFEFAKHLKTLSRFPNFIVAAHDVSNIPLFSLGRGLFSLPQNCCKKTYNEGNIDFDSKQTAECGSDSLSLVARLLANDSTVLEESNQEDAARDDRLRGFDVRLAELEHLSAVKLRDVEHAIELEDDVDCDEYHDVTQGSQVLIVFNL